MAAARSANERKMFVYQKERYMWWCDEGREKPSEVGNSKKKKNMLSKHTRQANGGLQRRDSYR